MSLEYTWIQELLLSLTVISPSVDINWKSMVEAEIKVHRDNCLEQSTAFLSKTAVSGRDTATQMWAETDWVS